jgi:hypothetical protein
MWALWNKAITVNQAKVDNLINQTCPLCDTEEESTLHKFWECCHVGLGIHIRHCMWTCLRQQAIMGGCPLTLETMCFCYQKSKASATCGEHMVLVKRYHTLDFMDWTKWFGFQKHVQAWSRYLFWNIRTHS